jgi:hypothetical protein
MKLTKYLVFAVLLFGLKASAATSLLSDFNSISGASITGSWVGQTSLSSGVFTVGGAAKDEIGFTFNSSINATSYGYLEIIAKVDSGNASNFSIRFEDSNLNEYVVTLLASSFTSSLTTIYVPLNWTAANSANGFDSSSITAWGFGGNGVGTVAFAYSVDQLALSTSAVPEPATYAAIFGLAALGFGAVRRRRKA